MVKSSQVNNTMFSYEENEKAVNKAIMKCLNESHEHWETNDDFIQDSVDTVMGVLRKMNIFQRDGEETLAAIFIENKLYSSDVYIGNDVQKALTFIRNNIDELKEELRIHRNYGKMIDENPNADWIE
ncbi:MAG: hypothetical protein J6R59_00280 [Paludibacteraceae bacterium]|nr:hypothetical protein [Paludibacteraceae bacterium]